MALDDFKQKWKKTVDVAATLEGMDKHKGDETAFNEFYSDFKRHVGNTGRYIDENGQERNLYILRDNANPVSKINHAVAYLDGARDIAFDYSTNNLEAILNDSRPELEDKFPDFVAAIEPKVDVPDTLVSAINAYRKARKPLLGETPDIKTIRERIVSQVAERMSMEGEESHYAKALQNLYRNSDKEAIAAYDEHILDPKKQRLIARIKTDNWNAYMRANISRLKTPEKIGFYLSLYKVLTGKESKETETGELEEESEED